MWVNTWATILATITWIVAGLIATGAEGPWWVTTGGLVLAVVVPIVFYPIAKLLTVALLLRLDPPQDHIATRIERNSND